MIGVLIIPTGIEAKIGGHAGDANPVAKLLGACCNKLILHPNVVNASDINEMPPNALYTEGSILDRFLEGDIELKERRRNNVLVVANAPLTGATINAVSAARATIGLEARVVGLHTPFRMIANIVNGQASGEVYGYEELVEQISCYDFDALAIHTPITTGRDVVLNYYRNGGVNPWGGVEARASKMVAEQLDKPVAHAPLDTTPPADTELDQIHLEIIKPEIAAESLSVSYLHCVLKGLHNAPIIGRGLGVQDVDFMVSPHGCFGRPHRACLAEGIPIIIVRENSTVLNDVIPTSDKIIVVENYWEAVGVIMSMNAGIHRASVRRPLRGTEVLQS